MSASKGMSLSFQMDPIQHRAMVLEHPEVFRNFRAPDVIQLDGDHIFAYHGDSYMIYCLLTLVRDWQRRPATDEQLRDILGASDGT